ncbi:MAG: LysR family transcriptional regulator [Mariprofundaceae bacterium]|nr:LysR family transcriptional regulator [Mariprofundaceae bacterium]
MMTFEQLRTFQAIVKHGGFRAASESMHKSQSAVSIAIRNLEVELKISLFERHQYRPSLTTEGELLLQKVNVIIQKMDELKYLSKQFNASIEPFLRIAMSAIVPIHPALHLFHAINERYPATQLSLLIETLNGTTERLEDDEADIAIAEIGEPNPNYDYAHITNIELISVVAAKSTWGQRIHELNNHEIQHITQIIMRDSSLHSQKKTVGVIEGTHRWTVTDLNSKKEIIISGVGWGRMPKHLVEHDIASGELISLPQSDFQPLQVPINAIRKKDKPMGVVAKELWQQFQDIDWLKV